MWKQKNPQSQSERNQWYQETSQYLFNLIWFEFVKETQAPIHQGLSNICRERGYKKILDFGGATAGTLRFILKNNTGIQPFYYDLPGVLKKFAQFRNEKEQLGLNFIDNEDLINVQAPFDFIIALDVLEHIENPMKYAAWLISMVRPGGMAYISAPFLAAGEKYPYPMHLEQNIKYAATFDGYMKSLGLEKKSENLWYKTAFSPVV
jgi:2-polyprenyl-3-methyl-5-hydroxy-6-metoxy-1,4-benzoquinol methylase